MKEYEHKGYPPFPLNSNKGRVKQSAGLLTQGICMVGDGVSIYVVGQVLIDVETLFKNMKKKTV